MDIGTLDLFDTLRRAKCDHAVGVRLLGDGKVGVVHALLSPSPDAVRGETVYHAIAWEPDLEVLPDIAATYFERSHAALFKGFCERDPACAPRPSDDDALQAWEGGEGHAADCPCISGVYPARADVLG